MSHSINVSVSVMAANITVTMRTPRMRAMVRRVITSGIITSHAVAPPHKKPARPRAKSNALYTTDSGEVSSTHGKKKANSPSADSARRAPRPRPMYVVGTSWFSGNVSWPCSASSSSASSDGGSLLIATSATSHSGQVLASPDVYSFRQNGQARSVAITPE
jgi:hypothetical protein